MTRAELSSTAIRPGPGLGVTAARPALPGPVAERLRRSLVTVGPRPETSVVTPLSEREIGRVPACGAEDVAAAVERARRAQRAWAARPAGERARLLRRVGRLLLARQAEGLDLVQLETGKPRGDAFQEVGYVALVAQHYARTAAAHLAPRRRVGALPLLTSAVELREPTGVVGVIAPWNYPLAIALGDALPALAAGNACVLKPAPTAPFTALWAAEVARAAGLPPDLLTVVTGEGDEVGTALVDAVDAVAFTGSTAVGREVAARAGRRLVPATLELGGKNAMVVLEDADLEVAVDGALRGCFASAGQLCAATERVLVHADLADAFADRLVERAAALRVGCELDWGVDVGPLASRQQLDRVRGHVDDAVADGARVLTGGAPRPDAGPLCYAPTLLADVTASMAVHGEETFGPVAWLAAFVDDDEAVAMANASDYGLDASVWTRDRRRGQRVARRLRTGTVSVNDAYPATWATIDAPMGGMGASGLGRRHGREGLWRFTDARTVITQRLLPVGRVPGLGDRANARAVTAVVRLLGRLPRPGLRRR